MAKSKMDTFEKTRKSLLDRYGSAEKAASTKKKEEEESFKHSGNAGFDSLRKELLGKYSTDQRKPVQTAPGYRRKSGTSLPSSQASRTKAMLDSSPDGGYGNYDATYSPARQGLSESSARYLRQQHYQQDKADYDAAQKRYQEAQERASALKDERRLAEARARLGDGKYSDSYFTDLAKREREAREAVGSAEDAMLPYKNRVDAYDATWGKVDKYADTVEKAKGTKGSYSGPSFEDMAAWEKQRSEDAMDQQMAAFRDAAYEDPENGPKVEDRLGFWLNLTEDQKQQETAVSGNAKHWGNLTKDEISAYYYLRQNQGQEAADQYLEDMENELSRREDAKFVKKVENAEGAELVGLNAASVAGNVLGGVPAAVDKAVGAVTGKQNPYSSGQMWQRYAGYVRGYTGQKVSDWAENGLKGVAGQELAERAGNLAKQTYQAVMSGVDSAAGALVFGRGVGIPAGPFTMHVGGYTTVMGLGAAAQRAQELQLQGATDTQIALGSIGSGILEALFEDVSAEAFFENILENLATTAKEFSKKLATQMGVEASEEVCTEIGNLIWDSAVRGKNSDHQQAEREYMEQGMSRQDAKTQAALDSAMDIFWAGYGGLISAGASSVVGQAFAGGQQAIEKARSNYEFGNYMAQNGGNVLDLAEQAETLTDEKAGRKLSKQAEKLAMELRDKEEPGVRGKYRMGKIAGDIAAQAQKESSEADVAAFREVAKNYLKDQENIKSPKRAEKLLVKAYTGEYMTRAEQVYFNSIGGKDLFTKVVDSTPYGSIQEAAETKQSKAWDTVMGLVDSAARETTINDVAAQYGKQAGAVERVYNMADTGSVTPENFGESFDAVYQKGAMGLPITEALKSTGVLTRNQAEMAYRIGTDAAGSYKSSDSGQAYITESREPVVVSSVESISEDGLTLKMDDGQTVNAKNVTFGSPEESMVYTTVGEVFQKAEDANRALTAWQNTGVSGTAFASALRDGYQKGRSGVDFARIRPKTEAGKLTQEIRKMAWEAGKASQDADTAKNETKLKSGTHKKAEAGLKVDQSVKDMNSYSRQQKTTLDLAKVLSKTGFHIEVFASTEEQRKSGVENGSFNTEDGSIRIDLNAGLNGEGLAAYALAHEVTHFAREFSPAKYQIFAETLIEAVNKSETSFEAMLDLKAAELSKLEAYQSLSETKLYDVAQDEVVAEMCETIFTNTDAAQRLSQRLYAKDQSLWGKFKSFMSDLVGRLKEAYAGLNPDSPIARRMKDTVTQSENVLNAWVEAVAGAVENYNLQDGETVNAGTVIDRDGNSVEYLNSARVEDKETLDFLNDQETVTTYKTMQLVDGKLYPPMAAVVAGSYEDHSELGTWEAATEHPELIKLDKSGKPKFTLNKGKGQGSLAAAYNPYMHSSNLVLNDQFSGAYTRPNLVTVECKVPTSELTSGYQAQYAKDSVGWHSWHTGTVAGALRQQTGTERQVFLSRWIMPVRIIPNSEVAQMYKQLLDGTDIAVPDNVVPPDLLKELKKAGVKISESGRVKNNAPEGVRFSIRNTQNMNWEDQIQGALYGKETIRRNDTLVVGTVSDFLVNDGVTQKPLAIPLSVLTKAMNGKDISHSIKKGKLAKLDSGIRNAPLVIVNPGRNAVVYVTSIKQGGAPILAAFNMDSTFDGDDVHKATSIHLQIDVDSMLNNLPADATVYVKNENELAAVGATNNLRGLAANVKFISGDSVAQDRANVNGENVRFSTRNQTTTENFKRWFGDWENDPANASKVVNADGTPKVLYHQTASDFTIFDPKYPGAGTRDNETPFGIFMKSSDKNIGLNGDKQMALYARIVNPLEVQDRQHLTRELEKISPDFSAISEEYRNLNEEYQRKVDDAGEAVRAHMLEWRKAHPDASRRAIYEDARYNELSDAEDALIDEWEEEAKKMEARSKEIITRDLEANGYDGVIILYDKGSFGRSTDTYIALHPEQVKSATDNIGTFDGSNPDIRFSSRTQQDAEYMELAKEPAKNRAALQQMVDQAAKDAGYTRLFYHGSKKGGGFTVFKDWQYFTENRDYASRYAERGNDKSLYTTYVRMENPFDTRIDSVRDIFEDARMEYGMGELQENGLPDWTDGYDIADCIDENDLPYDSIVLDEGGDMVNGKPVSRGLSYVVRKSSQVKSADAVTYDDSGNVIPLSQRFNTDADDIRYSRRGESAQQRLDRQQAEIDRLKELLTLQKYGNKNFTLDRNSVEKAASALLKSANAGGSKAELISLLDSFYRYLGTSGDLTWESVSKEAQKAVNFLVENRKTERDPYNQEVLDWMKGRHVALSQEQISEAEYLYGSLKEFRKALGGAVVLDQKANTTLDQFWQEAAKQYADKFSADTTDGDMPGTLAELVDSLRNGESLNTQEARYYEQEIRRDLTRQVYDSYWDVKPVQSVRDDMQKKLDLLKVEHRQAMEAAKAAARSEREKGQKALEDYRKQRDVVETTMMAAYAKQQAQVEQAYQQEMAELRKTYGTDTAAYQDEFFAAMKNKDFQNAHATTLRKMLNELAKDNSGGNKDAWAARKQVYDNLRQQYEFQKDIGALESKVLQQREAAKQKVESRRQTEMRKKIFDKAKTFQKMALAPRKANTAHAPVELMGTLADFCSIFYESEAKAAESKWQGLDQREATAMKKNAQNQERELEIIRNQRERLAKRAEAVSKLQSAYRGLKESNALSLFHDDHVQSLVDNLSSLLSQSDIYGMSSTQLNEVYNVMKAMEYTIINANKVFSAGKDKTLIGMTNKLSKEIKAVTVKHSPALNSIRKYWMWQMSPDTFFNYICGYAKGNEGKAIQQMFVTGMERMMGTQREFYQMFRPLTEATDKATAKAVRELMSKPLKGMVSWGLKNVDGQEVKTSKGMMLQAYMLLNQEDSFNSILYGGFKIPRMEEYYGGNRSDAYSNAETNQLLSAAIGESYMDLVHDIQEARQQGDQAQADALQTKAEEMTRGAVANLIAIRDQLSATIQADPTMSALVDTAAQWYKRSGELLAEVYEGMYGYKPNLVDGYTPIHRDLTTVKTDIREDSSAAFNLENIGLTKERVKSVAPIKLTDFFQELSDHTQQISRFYGFAQVQKDFNRIWNLKMPGSRSTVNTLVADKYGAGKSLFGVSGEEYINNYIKSVAGSSGGGSVLERFYGSAASATLSLNPRVAFSQLASIPTAAAEVGWGSMARGFAKGFTVGLSGQKKSILANDSIWFWQRYRGAGGSTEFSDLAYKGNLWSRVSGSKAGKALFNWCQSFDVFATSSMWAMAEDAVQHQQGLTPGTEGYQAAVEQKYADIIRKSQPNYTVTERSDLLRDKRAGMKLLTMYKTQSNQNLNILMNAWGEYKATMEGIKAGDGLYTQADKAAAGRKLANGITSVTIGGTLAFVLLRTAVNLVMGNLKYYRDDETDEMTGEGLVSGMVGEVLSSTAGMFALGGQLEEILYSAITGGRYYGISDSGISVIATAAEDGQKVLSTIFNREMEDGQKWQYLKKYSANLFYSAMTACGVPAKNAKTMLDAVGTWYTALTKGIPAAMESGETTATQYRARILRGWQEGDMGKIKDTLAILAANSEEDTDEKVLKDVTSGVAQYLKKVFMKNQISGEEAQKLLAYIGHESPEETVQNWVFKKMYPDSDLSNAGIAKWNSYQDIPLDVFESAYKYKGEHGKKAEIVAYIQGLNISASMKKRLWEALKGNWTNKDTPWN